MQEVAASETGRQTTGEASTSRSVITAENYSQACSPLYRNGLNGSWGQPLPNALPELDLLAQVVHPKYREALQLAASAFDVPAPASGKQAPLPLIFGSPEYLQVDFCMTQQITHSMHSMKECQSLSSGKIFNMHAQACDGHSLDVPY